MFQASCAEGGGSASATHCCRQQHTLITSIHSCNNQDVYSNGPNMLGIFNFYNDLMSVMVSWLPGWKAPGSNCLRVSSTFTVIHYKRCLWHCIINTSNTLWEIFPILQYVYFISYFLWKIKVQSILELTIQWKFELCYILQKCIWRSKVKLSLL